MGRPAVLLLTPGNASDVRTAPDVLAEAPGRIRRVRVRFSKPVRPEDTVTFQGKVTSVQDGRLTAEVSATNQRGEDVLKGAVVEASIG